MKSVKEDANARSDSSETRVTLTENSSKEGNQEGEAFAVSHPGGNTGTCTRTVRFNACLLVLLTLASLCLLFEALSRSLSPSARFLCVLTFPLTLFIFEWNNVHVPSLSRIKRAFFDVANVLETYQPRARTMGHLFQPDPPTPGPVVSFGESSEGHDAPEKRNAFTNARDQHYAGMYQEAFRMAKEMEAMEKSRGSVANDAAPSGKKLVAADLEADKKKAEKEKKEKQQKLK